MQQKTFRRRKLAAGRSGVRWDVLVNVDGGGFGRRVGERVLFCPKKWWGGPTLRRPQTAGPPGLPAEQAVSVRKKSDTPPPGLAAPGPAAAHLPIPGTLPPEQTTGKLQGFDNGHFCCRLKTLRAAPFGPTPALVVCAGKSCGFPAGSSEQPSRGKNRVTFPAARED